MDTVGAYHQAAVRGDCLHRVRDPADGCGHGCIQQPDQVNPGNAEHPARIDGHPRLPLRVADRAAAKHRADRPCLIQDSEARQRPLGVWPHAQRVAHGGQFRAFLMDGHLETAGIQRRGEGEPGDSATNDRDRFHAPYFTTFVVDGKGVPLH